MIVMMDMVEKSRHGVKIRETAIERGKEDIKKKVQVEGR